MESESLNKLEMKDTSDESLGEKSQSEVPNDVVPSQTTDKREIRLRRRPLGETL